MKTLYFKPVFISVTWLLLVATGFTPARAEPAESPLATVSDIDFTVEYSTEKLLLGDVLYAKTTIRNKTNASVRIEKFDLLFIRATTPQASELTCRDGCSGPNGGLFELMPGQSIICHQVLDVFGNAELFDGTFSPFDASLQGQDVLLQASRSTIPGDLREKIGSPKFVLSHEHKIKFGQPLIEKEAFDRAVAAELASDDLQPLKIFPFGLNAINSQDSYLMRRGFHYHEYNNTRLSISACLRVLSQTLPAHSTLRRAASLTLASERLALSSPDGEAKAISDIIALLAEASPIEREFLKGSILADFQSSRIGTYREPNVPTEAFDRFVQRLKDAGI